jgi:UDP-N-acetylmuramoylalanine-D-glutamate ligase
LPGVIIKIIDVFNVVDMMIEVSNMSDAVQNGNDYQKRMLQYCHLLASFDLSESYEDRGKLNKQAVKIL